jgi:hypothetical protein
MIPYRGTLWYLLVPYDTSGWYFMVLGNTVGSFGVVKGTMVQFMVDFSPYFMLYGTLWYYLYELMASYGTVFWLAGTL